jgi:hypothetical protein
LEEYGETGMIVGRLQTKGIDTGTWSLPEGSYTILLTSSAGKPVATLIDQEGKYVMASDNVFFVSKEH